MAYSVLPVKRGEYKALKSKNSTARQLRSHGPLKLNNASSKSVFAAGLVEYFELIYLISSAIIELLTPVE